MRLYKAWQTARQVGSERWWLRRLTPRDTVALGLRNVYILPTRMGWAFGGLLLVLLLTAISHQSNLSYLLTFLLAATSASAMWTTTRMLRGLHLQARPAAPGFAHTPLALTVQLTASDRLSRYALAVRFHRAPIDDSVWCDLRPHDTVSVTLPFVPTQRGWSAPPWVVVSSQFPLGLFRAWTVWRVASPSLVYPTLEAQAPPWTPLDGQGARGTPVASANEPDGVRPYRRGDPLKGIVWKKAAKSGELISRDVPRRDNPPVWFDYAQLALADPEHRLSRLAQWIVRAEAAGMAYGLRLPGVPPVPAAHGPAHRERCLTQLALWAPGGA